MSTVISAVTQRFALSAALVAALACAAFGQVPQSEGPRAPEPDAAPAAPAWQIIADAMQASRSRLAAGDAGRQTQQSQREAAAYLDAMIDAMAKNRASPEASQGKRPQDRPSTNPGDPNTAGNGDPAAEENLRDSVERHGTAVAEAPNAKPKVRTSVEEFWGRLPRHVREKVFQHAPTGQAPPKYQAAVEEYFQRLIEAERQR